MDLGFDDLMAKIKCAKNVYYEPPFPLFPFPQMKSKPSCLLPCLFETVIFRKNRLREWLMVIVGSVILQLGEENSV